ncbi:MAG: ATP-dependent DNA helicase [Candidatus Thermoplasmatota archaeon]
MPIKLNMTDIFPYRYRKSQREIIEDIRSVIDNKEHFIFESGTGSGKTICVLSATIPYALRFNKRIIYTTRTNAQQQQVLVELRAIKKMIKNTGVFGVGLQGRSNMCLLALFDSEINSGTSDELSRFCSYQKKQALNTKNKGCPYYRKFLNDKDKTIAVVSWMKKRLPTAEEFVKYCKKISICPYELIKIIIHEALVVVVPYIYIFDKTIRIKLLDWMGVSDDDIILIVDEAHNLPDYLRESYSADLSIGMLNGCIYEAEKHGNPSLIDGDITISDFCRRLSEIIFNIRDTYVYKLVEGETLLRENKTEYNDAFIPSHEFESEILYRFHINEAKYHDIVSDLVAYGEKIQEYKQKQGKLPRSYIHKLGVFLDFWLNIESDHYIKLVVDDTQGKNPRIEAYCLDSSLGASVIKQFHSSIHMSGTLKPLEEYRDSLGLPFDTILKTYPSPFPSENRRVFYIEDVTTRYEDISNNDFLLSRLWGYISTICNTFPRNTMVCFPSYNTLSYFRDRGWFNDIKRCLYVEEQSLTQSRLMELVSDFKSCSNNNGAALFSVIGGRISEGMDFPAEELEIAVIVGIPYPKPTARQRGLQHYYDIKFGKGWEYTVEAPAARKLLQSIGRLIRDENDRGVAVILDKRAPRFKRYIPDMKESNDIIKDIHVFLQQGMIKKEVDEAVETSKNKL